MILIYAHTAPPRLQYITHFIFRELMGVDTAVVIDSEYFSKYDGIKINYSTTELPGDHLTIRPHPLLFETGIKEQTISCFEVNNTKAFFKTVDADLPFDILAAAFYLLTRYEEYLPHTKDEYGRYAHTNSLAFKEDFLQQPLINTWVRDLAKVLSEKFAAFDPQFPAFKFIPTYDIDIAYSYRHKGFIRNVGGFLKRPSLERIKVLCGLAQDPYDAYKWLDELHKQYGLEPLYFFLVPEKNGRYDKNILPHKDIMWKLVKYHAKRYAIGLHPSWQSGDNADLLYREKEYLEDMGGIPVTRSRQHYIRFNLPEGYKRLISIGINADFSMGYGSINGFRASTASSFYWYDLMEETQTFLRVTPFCFMEGNAYFEQKISAEEAYKELMGFYTICKATGGTLCTIWHNSFLGTDKQFTEWRDMYKKFISAIS